MYLKLPTIPRPIHGLRKTLLLLACAVSTTPLSLDGQLCLAQSGPVSTDESLYDEAGKLFSAGDFAGAKTIYERMQTDQKKAHLASDNAHCLSVLFQLARCEYQLNHEQNAHGDLKKLTDTVATLKDFPPPRLNEIYGLQAQVCHKIEHWSEEAQAWHQTVSAQQKLHEWPKAKTAAAQISEAVAMMRAGDKPGGKALLSSCLDKCKANSLLVEDLPAIYTFAGNTLTNSGGDCLPEAPGVFQQLLDYLPTKPSVTLAMAHFNYAIALNHLCKFDQAVGQNRLALNMLEEKVGPDNRKTINAMAGLGQALDLAGRYTEAREPLMRAHQAMLAKYGPDDLDAARIANNLADVQRNLGDLEAARALDERALACRLKGLGRNAPDTWDSQRNLSTDLLLLSRYSEAAVVLDALLKNVTETVGVGAENSQGYDVRYRIAKLHVAEGKSQLAEKEFQDLVDENGLGKVDPQRQISIFNALGQLKEKLGDKKAADQFDEKAFFLAKDTYGPDHPDSLVLQSNLLAGRQQGHTALALSDLTDLNDRVLALMRREIAMTQDATTKEKLLTLFATTRELIVSNAIDFPTRTNCDFLLNAIEDWRSFGLPPKKMTQAVASGKETAKNLRQALADGSGLLTYWILPPKRSTNPEDAQIYAMLNTANSPDKVLFLGKVGPLEQFSRLGKALQSDRCSAGLYKQLIDPFKKELSTLKKLYLSPDGALYVVSFEALHAADSPYLIEQLPITLVRQIGAVAREQSKNASTQHGTLIIGDIDYGQSKSATSQMPPLIAHEADAIAKELNGSRFAPVKLVKGKAASKQCLINWPSPPLILHLDTHGCYGAAESPDANPLTLVQIAMAGANEDTADHTANMLSGLEVSRLNLKGTDLVVLSSCQSGLGKASYVNGLSGMASAIALAGARRSLLALTSVSDFGTAELMQRFYHHLTANGRDYAAALRAAKLETIKETIARPSTPTDWKSLEMITN